MLNSKRSNTAPNPAKDKNLAGPTARPERIQIVKPMLPGSYERMLRNQSTDKYLDHIQVDFFQKGMTEIKFVVRSPTDGTLSVLTAGGYQSFRNSLEAPMAQNREIEAAEQFFRKLESRCWIKCSDHSVENARKVKAMAWPPLILHAFNITQKDAKAKKLTPARMFAIWKERNDLEKKVISKFQREVDPEYDWGETLAAYSLFAERTLREQKEKEKEKIAKEQAVLASDKWADLDELFTNDQILPLKKAPARSPDPFSSAFEDFSQNENNDDDGGDDPLNRPTSPKLKKAGLRGFVSSALGLNKPKGEEEKVETTKDAEATERQ